MARATTAQPVTGTTVGGVFVVSAEAGDATLTYTVEGGTDVITPLDGSAAGNPVIAGNAAQFALPTCNYTLSTTGSAVINRGNS